MVQHFGIRIASRGFSSVDSYYDRNFEATFSYCPVECIWFCPET